jgi:hypothetical protein
VDAAKEVYVDRTDVVEGMLVRENMLDVNDFVWKLCLWTSLLGELQIWVGGFYCRKIRVVAVRFEKTKETRQA